LQETSKKLDSISAKKKDLGKRLHDHDKKDMSAAKKRKT